MKKIIKVLIHTPVDNSAKLIKIENINHDEYAYYEIDVPQISNELKEKVITYSEKYANGCGGAMSGKPSACGCGECG